MKGPEPERSSEARGGNQPQVPHCPGWVPEVGLQLAQVGIYFSAVRVTGERGIEVGESLIQHTGGQPGAILHRTGGELRTYFLTAPGSGEGLRWPPGIVDLSRTARVEHLTIPAVTGDTDPFGWWSPPCAVDAFVDPEVLHGVVCRLLNWPASAGARAAL